MATKSKGTGRDYNARKTHCPQGHEYTPENTYTRNGGRACRACMREHRRTNPRIKARSRLNSYRKSWRDRQTAITAYGGKCVRCGEADPIVLEFDHINGNGNQQRKANSGAHLPSWLIRNNFPDDIQLLCANCHRRKTAKEHSWYQ